MNRGIARIGIPKFESQSFRVERAMARGHLATGPDLDELEEVLRRRFGRRNAIPVSSGFAALSMALRFATAVEGHAVSTPISTCFAVPNAVAAANRRLRFVDVEPKSIGMPPFSAERRDAVIVAVDHFGTLSPILRGSSEAGIPVIHDAAQSFMSLGATRTDKPLATTLSFYPTKLANGIDGGAVLIDDDDLAEQIRRFCDYGSQSSPEPGYRVNLRMANLHAAFLLGTLDHLEDIRHRMRSAFERLSAAVRRAGFGVENPGEDATPTRFIIRARAEHERDALIARMRGAGVEACKELMWLCVPSERHAFPAADALVKTTCSLPLHPCLTDDDLERMERLLG